MPYDRRVWHSYAVEAVKEAVLSDQTVADAFTEFVESMEPRLRQVLSAAYGSEAGREATADALAYGWEHWDRVRAMGNPAGYLYAVGRDRARIIKRLRRPVFLPVESGRLPWVEPGLPDALSRLPERQRVVVMLLYCFQWTMSEAADFLGISKSTVQSYAERGMTRLRQRMGVEQ